MRGANSPGATTHRSVLARMARAIAYCGAGAGGGPLVMTELKLHEAPWPRALVHILPVGRWI
jgi:hypothetical protein